jgi:hypothetical protein
VKFHWRPKLGLQSTLWDEAVKVAGADPDFHRRDLYEAIRARRFPEWEFAVQLFTQEEPDAFPFDHLDTQLSRLGSPNFHQIPVNAPKCPLANHQRDGHMQMGQPSGSVAYEPSTFAVDAPREVASGGFRSLPVQEAGQKGRVRPESFADHYSQARLFFLSQTPHDQAHLASALVFELSKVVRPAIRKAMVGHLRNIDEGLAGRVAHGLGMEGSSAGAIKSISNAAAAAGARVRTVALRVGPTTLDDGSTLEADGQLAGTPSVVFDAIAVVLSGIGRCWGAPASSPTRASARPPIPRRSSRPPRHASGIGSPRSGPWPEKSWRHLRVQPLRRNGMETGAPSRGRMQQGAAMVFPRPFWSASR